MESRQNDTSPGLYLGIGIGNVGYAGAVVQSYQETPMFVIRECFLFDRLILPFPDTFRLAASLPRSLP
jgi:hypothetical protein